MLDDEELAIFDEKIARIQSDIEKTFLPLLELIPGPYNEEEKEYMGFINAIWASVAEQTSIINLKN